MMRQRHPSQMRDGKMRVWALHSRQLGKFRCDTRWSKAYARRIKGVKEALIEVTVEEVDGLLVIREVRT